jgi:formylglycine-generating enzyme required for sulfatase activity
MEKWNPQPFQRFKAEFKGILQGIQGVEKQQIGRDLLSGFIPLVGTHKPCDTGIFVMGADQKDDHARTKLEHYRLHQFCVTNVDYELFDPCHKHYRWWDFEGHHHHPLEKVGSATSPEDRCPVVLVSWYDAWCLARWLGVFEQDGKTYRIMLPTEEQWEYACRAGKLTPFSFQAPHDGLSCTPDICNFNGNNPFPEGVKLSAEAQALCYRQATIPVDDLAPNPWGFFQMHGNVWEWCNNYYNDIDKCERDYRDLLPVLRGGSWLSCGLQCQSDSSYFDDPEFSWNYYGFRLAAIPE